jgi:hypothetical protein
MYQGSVRSPDGKLTPLIFERRPRRRRCPRDRIPGAPTAGLHSKRHSPRDHRSTIAYREFDQVAFWQPIGGGVRCSLMMPLKSKIAKDAGCRAINEVMDARQRFSPWEVNEAWLKIAIAQELHREARKPGLPPWRIHDEYPENKITNVRSPDLHPFDIVVLHPLMASDDPWSHRPALGAIEIKKDWSKLIDLIEDARRLARLARLSPAKHASTDLGNARDLDQRLR